MSTSSRGPVVPVVDLSPADLAHLFHRLNNQLGIILANAELLENRVTDDTQRARAGQVVAGTLDAIATVQSIRKAVRQTSEV